MKIKIAMQIKKKIQINNQNNNSPKLIKNNKNNNRMKINKKIKIMQIQSFKQIMNLIKIIKKQINKHRMIKLIIKTKMSQMNNSNLTNKNHKLIMMILSITLLVKIFRELMALKPFNLLKQMEKNLVKSMISHLSQSLASFQ